MSKERPSSTPPLLNLSGRPQSPSTGDKDETPFSNPFGRPARPAQKVFLGRTSVMKQLQQMEDRSNKALREIQENRESILSGSGVLVHVRSPKDTISHVKQTGMQNMEDHMKVQLSDEQMAKKQLNFEELERDYQSRIAKLESDLLASKYENDASKKEVDRIRSEYDSQKHITELLRLKLSKMTDREIENQRKLKIFSKMEPIFQRLSERFDFASPEDVIERLENLERSQLDSYTQLLEAQEQRNMMERKLEQTLKEKEEYYRLKLLELTQALEKSEKQYSDLEVQYSKLQQALQRADDIQDKYLKLSFSVLDLYNRWLKSEISHQRKIHASHDVHIVDNPDLSDPAQLVTSMQNMLSYADSNVAAEKLREISGVANSLWLNFFSEDLTIKAKPKDIFLRVYRELEAKDSMIRKLKTQTAASQKLVKELETESYKFSKEKKRLEEQIDQLGRLLRSLSTRPLGESRPASPISYVDTSSVKEKKTPSPSRPESPMFSITNMNSKAASFSTSYSRPSTPVGTRVSTVNTSNSTQRRNELSTSTQMKNESPGSSQANLSVHPLIQQAMEETGVTLTEL